jgi:hypothetical protein
VAACELGGGWREPIQGKEGGGTGLAGGHTTRKGGVPAVDSGVARAGMVTVGRARCCAAWKKRGKALGYPGKERKEGEEGAQPSDTAEGT